MVAGSRPDSAERRTRPVREATEPEENTVTERTPSPLTHWPSRARVTPAPAAAARAAAAPSGDHVSC
jgi:hypothetical protein